MRARNTVLSVVLATAGALCLIAGVASANTLSLSNRQIRTTWARLEFIGEWEGGAQIGNYCAVTLEGSFHSSTLRKVAGALVGHLTRASVARCQLELITVSPLALPWHIRYQGFRGTLPTLTGLSIDVVGMSWDLNSGGIRCLYRSTTARPAAASILVTRGVLSALTFSGAVPKGVEDIFCSLPTQLLMLGSSGPVTLLGTTTAVTVTLI
jgi:hypothetical protein